MNDTKYSKLITVLLISAIIIILLVLGFLGFRLISNNSIKSDAEDAVEKFQGDKKNNQSTKSNDQNDITNTDSIEPVISLENTLVNDNRGTTNNNSRQMYKGYPMVGTIEIPSINVKYPILEKATTAAIKVSVAIYDENSAGLNKVGNTTIVGHNYRNGTFFSDNKKIVIGDKVYITDESGVRMAYIVYDTLVTAPEDSSYMERDTEGKREISLLTCTDDTQSRLIVFAREE